MPACLRLIGATKAEERADSVGISIYGDPSASEDSTNKQAEGVDEVAVILGSKP